MESMGLAAPRRKTKYDIDPRNNAWANDDNKFGQKLMEKFGWAKGKGLGAQEDGETENIKVKVKNDKHGIGANNDYSDTWLDHQDDFNSILASLNTCHSAPGSGTATPTNEESTEAVVGSMEERSKSSKSRVHYKKFTRSKDLTRADASDLDALFGRRKKFEKRSRKLQKAAQSEPASPFAGMSPLGTTPAGGNSPRTEDDNGACDVKVEANDSCDKEYDAAGNLRTVTSTMSVSDYFAKKMAEIKAKRSGAPPTAVDAFCDNSIRQIKEEIKEEKTEEEEEEKPEVYRQEKFQAASLSVQQYFELKMKEKKARAEAAAVKQEVEDNNNNADGQTVEDSVAENDETAKKEKKKKKRKKEKNMKAEESKSEETSDAQSDTADKPKKEKKKKVKENLLHAETSVTSPPVEAETGDEAARVGVVIVEKDKKRKRKLESDEGEKPDSGHAVEQEVVKKKKKKNSKSLEKPSLTTKDESGTVQETKVKSEETPSDGSPLKKKKKKKKKNSERANVC